MSTIQLILNGLIIMRILYSACTPQDMLEALKSLSTFFTENNLRSRRNLRGDIERRSLAINEEFVDSFKLVKEVGYLQISFL